MTEKSLISDSLESRPDKPFVSLIKQVFETTIHPYVVSGKKGWDFLNTYRKTGNADDLHMAKSYFQKSVRMKKDYAEGNEGLGQVYLAYSKLYNDAAIYEKKAKKHLDLAKIQRSNLISK